MGKIILGVPRRFHINVFPSELINFTKRFANDLMVLCIKNIVSSKMA